MTFTIVTIVTACLVLFAILTALGTRAIEGRHAPRGRFIDVDGTRLHILELGQADAHQPPVLLLHGATANVEEMRIGVGERLAQRHHVIIVDRPGLGWSTRGDHRQAVPAHQAEVLARLLDRLGIDRAIVVGHSLGGTVALAFALAAPERTAGLVLLAPVAYPWRGGVAWYYNVAGIPLLGRLFAATLALPLGLRLIEGMAHSVFAPCRMPEGYVERTAIKLILRPSAFLANARDVAVLKQAVAAQAPLYPQIQTPTVVITGDQDSLVVPRYQAEPLARALPNAELVVLRNVGHMPQYAAPDRVVEAVDDLNDTVLATARAAQ